jgi:hypothetical protein
VCREMLRRLSVTKVNFAKNSDTTASTAYWASHPDVSPAVKNCIAVAYKHA